MTTHQFFIKQSQIGADGLVTIDGPDARHIRLVLRLKKNSRIRLVDEKRNLHLASVENISERSVVALIRETEGAAPSGARLTVIQGIPRLPKADFIAQKLTELGARNIIFAPTERTPYTDGFERISKKLGRLRKIAEAAAKQCARRDIPTVVAYDGLAAAVEAAGPDALVLVADENSPGQCLRELLAGDKGKSAVTVIIGPEGGLSPEETAALEGMGAAGFSLGRNILRTETAAVVAAAIILYEMGEI